MEGDPLRAMLNEGTVTRQRTMGNIGRNNETDSTNSYRFRSFVPRFVRLFNRTPVELKHQGHLEWADFKVLLRKHCMEQVLGPQVDWPNYDEMNGCVLPSDAVLFARGEMIVKKKNGLFIEPYVSPYPPPEPDNSDVDSPSDNRAASVSSPAATSSAATPIPDTIIAVTDILTELIHIVIKRTAIVRKDT